MLVSMIFQVGLSYVSAEYKQVSRQGKLVETYMEIYRGNCNVLCMFSYIKKGKFNANFYYYIVSKLFFYKEMSVSTQVFNSF